MPTSSLHDPVLLRIAEFICEQDDFDSLWLRVYWEDLVEALSYVEKQRGIKV